MRKKLSLFFLLVGFIITPSSLMSQDMHDAIVASKPLKEIADSLFEKEYFIVAGNDTSYFSCIFTENKKNKSISLAFRHDIYKKSHLISLYIIDEINERDFEKRPYYKTTYRQKIDEIKLILKKAAGDFDLNKLQRIDLANLLYCGDLAIELTNWGLKEFGAKITNYDYRRIKQILLDSLLGADLNLCLNPYSIYVENISIEKLTFAPKEKLYEMSNIETDTSQIPDKILTCFVYVELRNENPLYAKRDHNTGLYAYYDQYGNKVLGDFYLVYTKTLNDYAIVSNPIPILINRKGDIIYHIFIIDNGPDYTQEGLYRIIENGKIGYVDSLTSQIVIKPQFQAAYPFENGKAKVSFYAKTIKDGEYSCWDSDEWFYIDKNGDRIKSE